VEGGGGGWGELRVDAGLSYGSVNGLDVSHLRAHEGGRCRSMRADMRVHRKLGLSPSAILQKQEDSKVFKHPVTPNSASQYIA